ncbi:hypothetical protein KY363_07505 [Candidatus Woesearchaeota archaeon]|nr:hypothetical protein [Candidatus Woesearchaeota archaeon]
MAFWKYIKAEFWQFMKAFSFDRRFWKILMWEVILGIALFVGMSIWANMMNSLEPLMQQATMPFTSSLNIENSLLLHNPEQALGTFKVKLFEYTAVFALFLLLVWPLFKALTYTTLLGKKLGRILYLKFIAAEVVWTAILAVVFYLVQLFFYKTIFYQLPYSALARVTFLLGSVLLLVLLCYFTITLFVIFTRLEGFKAGLKEYWRVPLRRIRYFIVPMVFTFLLFIVLNIIMRWISYIPQRVSFLINVVVVLAYVVILKVYYCSCVARIGEVSSAAHGHHAASESGRKAGTAHRSSTKKK